jgi:hypothetical protein
VTTTTFARARSSRSRLAGVLAPLAILACSLGAVLACSLGGPAALAVAAKSSSPTAPRAATGGIGHVRGTSAVLQGTVNPHGLDTTYYFKYGPTAAYGQQTPAASVGKGTSTVKVGQTVAVFPVGYHYRIVATNSAGTREGRDRIYTASKGRLKFAMASTKEAPPVLYGGTFLLRGTLSGSGGALHSITAQASPYPFLTAFGDIGTALLTNAAGAFAIPIKGLTKSTQLRVRTNDPRPLLSPIVTARVAVRVTLKVRTSSRGGLVRLYGTVTPAEVGARVLFQVEKAVRPHGKKEKESRFASQGSSVVKRATRTFSRFSQVLTIRKGGHYRAYVVLHTGPLVSGASPSLTLHGAPATKRKGR